VLALLERTSDRKSVRDQIAFSVELLMEVITATEHEVGYLTSRGIQTALGLIYNSTRKVVRLWRACRTRDIFSIASK
jgi:hypothetical protein